MASVFFSAFVKGVTEWLSLIRRTPTTSSTTTTVVDDLEWLERTLTRIESSLKEAENRDILDDYLKLWLTELKDVAYDAKDLLEEYEYEVLRAQVDMAAAVAAPQASRKRKRVVGEEEVLMPLATSSASNIATRKISILSNMADRIKKIRERLDEISKDRDRLHLKSEDAPRRRDSISSYDYPPPTGHMIDEQKVYGREDDREELMDWLFSKAESKCEVLAVVGKGGLGKTTLAKLVYNHPKVKDYFQQKMWISASRDFDTIRLTRAMIESITEDSCGLSELSVLQTSLQQKLDGKKVLLVLDDVWNENKNSWQSLRSPFGSAQMIRIIVTTRNTSVAEVMQTTRPYFLRHLREEQCRKLFMSLAFCHRDPKQFPMLVGIGEKIVKKCDGLPLAVKSLGALLQDESDEGRWNDVLDSELWNEETDVLPALKLSYIRMPSDLKPCFQICSIFPKAYMFDKDELIKLWAAHGYIHQHNGKKNTMEEIGYEYFYELHRRSFFDELRIIVDGERKYKMHDNIHDLARYVLEGRDLRKEGEHKIRHLYIKNESLESHLDNNNGALRTLVVRPEINISIVSDMLGRNTRRLTHLRYLKILQYSPSEEEFSFFKILPHSSRDEKPNEEEFLVPEGIGNLICLRHLALANTSGGTLKLPNSIGVLYNLVVLEVTCHHGVVELPDTLRSLVSLTTVSFSGFSNDQLPILGHLPSLRSLALSHFDNVESIGNEFCRGGNNRNHVAFPSLTSLVLRDLDNLDKWDELQEGDFPRLQKLQIESCMKLSSLPSLRHLDSLSHMILGRCGSLQFPSVDSFPPKLKNLGNIYEKLSLPQGFGELEELKGLSGIFGVRIDELFGILNKLVSLKYLILSNADSESDDDELFDEENEALHLVVERSHDEGSHNSHNESDSEDASFSQLINLLPGTLINLVSLTTIYFCGFHIDQLPTFGQLPSLKSLTLMMLHNVKSIGNEFYRGDNSRDCVAFSSLTSIVFLELTNWETWDEVQEGDFPQLQKLDIINCQRLSSLSPLRNLGLLSHISLRDCALGLSSVSSFPLNLKNLHNTGDSKLCLRQGFGELKKLERLIGIFGVRMDEVFGILEKLVSFKNLILSELWNAHRAWNGEACLKEFGGIEKLTLNWALVDELQKTNEFAISFYPDEVLHLVVERDDNKGRHHSDHSEKEDSDDGDDETRKNQDVLYDDEIGEDEDEDLSAAADDDDDDDFDEIWEDEDAYVSDDDGTTEISHNFWFPPHDSREVEESLLVLEKLQPHTNLKELYIVGYYGVGYPRWIGHPSFDRLNQVHLRGCKVDQLPTLGQLPSLTHLHLHCIDRLKRIGDEFCRGGINDVCLSHDRHAAAFPSLIKLQFEDMYHWEQWDDGVRQGDFPKLESLSIHGCPKLSQVPVLRNLGMNLELSIYECPAIHHSAEASFPRNMKALRYDNVEPRTYVSPGAELQNLEILEGVFRARNDELFEILNNLPMKTDTMTIAALRNVRSSSVMAAGANLKSKQGLWTLILKWSSDINRSFGLCLVVDDKDDEGRTDQTENASFIVLEKLQPHISLWGLNITGYDGLGYPSWIGHPSFNRLVRISLSSCSNDQLPTLGQLPSLHVLKINSISGLKRIGHEFCRDTMTNDDNVAFPSLLFLSFEAMHDWEEWCEVLDGDFPRLEELTIEECSRLRRDLISLPQRLLNLIDYD